MKPRLFLIANPKAAAGRAARRWQALLEGARRRCLVEHAITMRPGHAVELARTACGNYDAIIAVGGDGTVNEVASGILLSVGPETPLGIVPFGTGNDVAQLLGIRTPDDVLAACAARSMRSIDVIEVRCQEAEKPVTRYALLYASVGFAGELVRWTTPAVKCAFGARYCYSVGFFLALVSYRSPRMKVRCDDRLFEGRMFLACAGNAEYVAGGVMRLSPGAKIDDGKLNVSIIDALGRWETVRQFPRLLRGEHVGHPKVCYLAALSLTVEPETTMNVQVDGECFGQTPVTFAIKPRALSILAPTR
jgi:diacylglycerol kinase (ATP)